MAYEIEFISDQRFKGTKAKLQSMDRRLKIALNGLVCVSIRDKTGIREVHFPEAYGEKASKQWRKSYIISKSCNDVTWGEIMEK